MIHLDFMAHMYNVYSYCCHTHSICNKIVFLNLLPCSSWQYWGPTTRVTFGVGPPCLAENRTTIKLLRGLRNGRNCHSVDLPYDESSTNWLIIADVFLCVLWLATVFKNIISGHFGHNLCCMQRFILFYSLLFWSLVTIIVTSYLQVPVLHCCKACLDLRGSIEIFFYYQIITTTLIWSQSTWR